MSELEKNITHLLGDRGKQWIKHLPHIITSLAQKWQLTEITPVENMTWNYVAKASSKLHGAVCIKVSADENLIADEIKTLDHFDGHGIIKLIDHDTQFHALLLHQAIPGKSLKHLYQSHKEKAIILYTNVIKELLSAPKANVSLYKHVRDWLKALDSPSSEDSVPKGLVAQAKSLSAQMLKQANNEFILHGDLHLDNIISDHDNWIAIDPKGIIGPTEFEVACFDFITKDELALHTNIPELFDTRALKLSQLLGINYSALKNWVFIRLVLGACWMVEDNNKADVFLHLIQAIFPAHWHK